MQGVNSCAESLSDLHPRKIVLEKDCEVIRFSCCLKTAFFLFPGMRRIFVSAGGFKR